DRAASLAERHLDLEGLRGLARPLAASALSAAAATVAVLPPLGQRIAIARDVAFAFAYASLLDDWRAAGADLSYFSPLQDQAPAADGAAVYLPGGYPELHAGRIAANAGFLGGLRWAAARGAAIYGECGGYMVLGDGLVDAEGQRHAMAGLLPLETSFARRPPPLRDPHGGITGGRARGRGGGPLRRPGVPPARRPPASRGA